MPKPYIPHDKWSRRAEVEGYRARSVYKLMELDERLQLLRLGMKVLDLGAAPGSWLQYVTKTIGPRGKALGMDILEIPPVAGNIRIRVQDITDRAAVERILREEGMETLDLVLSDIAPSTSGVKDVDQWRSVELALHVLEIAADHLVHGGRFVVKVFRGADFDAFLREVRSRFRRVRTMTVKASRERSREIYVTAEK